MLNTDLILAYYKLYFGRNVPTSENKLVFFPSSLGYTERKLSLPIKSLDLVYFVSSANANIELCLKKQEIFKIFFNI